MAKKQSGRLVWNGKDHVDLACKEGNEFYKSHSALFQGNTLLWYKYLDECWVYRSNTGDASVKRVSTFHPDTKKDVIGAIGGEIYSNYDRILNANTSNKYYLTGKGGSVFNPINISVMSGNWRWFNDSFVRDVGEGFGNHTYYKLQVVDGEVQYNDFASASGWTSDFGAYTTYYDTERIFLSDGGGVFGNFRFLNKDGSFTFPTKIPTAIHRWFSDGTQPSFLVEQSHAYLIGNIANEEEYGNYQFPLRVFRMSGTGCIELGKIDTQRATGIYAIKRSDGYYLYLTNNSKREIYRTQDFISFTNVTPSKGYCSITTDNGINIVLLLDPDKRPSVSANTVIIDLASTSIGTYHTDFVTSENSFSYWVSGEQTEKQGTMLTLGNRLTVFIDNCTFSESTGNWAKYI